MQYQFLKNVMVDGVLYTAGTVVEEGVVPAGCLNSLRGVQHICEITSEQPAPIKRGRGRPRKSDLHTGPKAATGVVT